MPEFYASSYADAVLDRGTRDEYFTRGLWGVYYRDEVQCQEFERERGVFPASYGGE